MNRSLAMSGGKTRHRRRTYQILTCLRSAIDRELLNTDFGEEATLPHCPAARRTEPDTSEEPVRTDLNLVNPINPPFVSRSAFRFAHSVDFTVC